MNDRLISSRGVLWRPSGLRIELAASPMRNGEGGGPLRVFRVGDLNPEREVLSCVTRTEALRIGFWLIFRAIFPSEARK